MKNNLLFLLFSTIPCLIPTVFAQNVFQVINTFNSGLPNNMCWDVKVAGNNEIFATTWGGGIAKMDNNGTVQNIYNTSNSLLTTNLTTAIKKGPNDLLYIASEGGGILKRENQNWSLLTSFNSGLSGNITYTMEYDKLGSLWFGTRYNSVSVLDSNGAWTYYNSSNSTLANTYPVYGIAIDALDNKWIGTGFGGLHRKTAAGWTRYTTGNSNIPHNDVYAVTTGANGVIWVGTLNGLGKFNGSTWTNYTTFNSGLPYNYIRHLKVDANNNVWIATDGGGIAKFSGTAWTVYNTSNSNLPSNRVYALDIDAQGYLWAATYGGGVVKMIDPLTNVTLSAFSPVCIASSPIVLTGGSPAGGTYSGPGVNAGVFDPLSVGVGTHTITYNYTDPSGFSGSASANIDVTALPIVSLGAFSPVCFSSGSFALTGGVPAGGTYSGNGVGAGIFDPSAAGAGSHQVTYTYTDLSGCSASASVIIMVNDNPIVSIATVADMCSDALAVQLNATPAGGVFTGNGITGNTFDPAIAGSGMHTIQYMYIDVNGCSGSTTLDILVNPLPIISLGNFGNMNTIDPALSLGGGLPVGGAYSGAGVISNIFYPAIAGAGVHVITYTFMNEFGCVASTSTTIEVIQSAAVSLDPFNNVCHNAAAFMLNGGQPLGGIYSGAGVTGGIFDPSVAGVGAHMITYTVNNQAASQSITVNPVPSVSLTSSASLSCSPNTIYLGYGSQSVLLTAVSATAVSYQWFINGNPVKKANSSTFAASLAGVYSVTVTDAEGCTSSSLDPASNIQVNVVDVRCGKNMDKVLLCHYPHGNNVNPQQICISANAIAAHLEHHIGDCLGSCSANSRTEIYYGNFDMHVIPNPASEYSEISLTAFYTSDFIIELFDLQGKLIKTVFEGEIHSDDSIQVNIDTKELKPGFYLIRTKSDQEINTSKLIIVK